jgi:Zn finger protein HypA/HybF involved in hydrogenase expression
MKVKCESCATKVEVLSEIFDNYEIIFCPVCGLTPQVIKKTSRVIVKSVQCA